MDTKTATKEFMDQARNFAVRDVNDLTPGIYRVYMPHLPENNFYDIYVIGMVDHLRFRCVDLRSHYGIPHSYSRYLSDAGVKRTSDGYLGTNFLVPSSCFDCFGNLKPEPKRSSVQDYVITITISVE